MSKPPAPFIIDLPVGAFKAREALLLANGNGKKLGQKTADNFTAVAKEYEAALLFIQSNTGTEVKDTLFECMTRVTDAIKAKQVFIGTDGNPVLDGEQKPKINYEKVVLLPEIREMFKEALTQTLGKEPEPDTRLQFRHEVTSQLCKVAQVLETQVKKVGNSQNILEASSNIIKHNHPFNTTDLFRTAAAKNATGIAKFTQVRQRMIGENDLLERIVNQTNSYLNSDEGKLANKSEVLAEMEQMIERNIVTALRENAIKVEQLEKAFGVNLPRHAYSR